MDQTIGQEIEQFSQCKCQKRCMGQFEQAELVKIMQGFRQMGRQMKHYVVTGMIFAAQHVSSTTSTYSSFTFLIRGCRVCRNVLMFILNISNSLLVSITKEIRSNATFNPTGIINSNAASNSNTKTTGINNPSGSKSRRFRQFVELLAKKLEIPFKTEGTRLILNSNRKVSATEAYVEYQVYDSTDLQGKLCKSYFYRLWNRHVTVNSASLASKVGNANV